MKSDMLGIVEAENYTCVMYIDTDVAKGEKVLPKEE